MRIELGKEERRKDGSLELPVLIKVPLAKLELLPHEGVHVGSLSLCIMSRDADGNLSTPRPVPLPIEIQNERLLAALSQSAAYSATLRLRPGAQKIAVGVRDEVAGVTSTLNLALALRGKGR